MGFPWASEASMTKARRLRSQTKPPQSELPRYSSRFQSCEVYEFGVWLTLAIRYDAIALYASLGGFCRGQLGARIFRPFVVAAKGPTARRSTPGPRSPQPRAQNVSPNRDWVEVTACQYVCVLVAAGIAGFGGEGGGGGGCFLGCWAADVPRSRSNLKAISPGSCT